STGCTDSGSTDGLREVFDAIELPKALIEYGPSAIAGKPGPWPDQNTKRTALLQHAALHFPGALLFIVDADEFVTGAETLRQTPEGDVAWVGVTSPLYQRPYGQPRLVRAREGLEYRGRHHWLYAGDELVATHQYGG